MTNICRITVIIMMIAGMIVGLASAARACESCHSCGDMEIVNSSNMEMISSIDETDMQIESSDCGMSACSSAIETAERNCPKCDGSGRCHMCCGSGRYNDHTCNTCNGTGRCFYCNGDGDLWN